MPQYRRSNMSAWSMARTGSDYMTTDPNVVAHNIGTGDFTVAGWFKPTAETAIERAIWTNGILAPTLFHRTSSDAHVSYYIGGANNPFSTTLVLNAWHHLVLMRQGGVVMLFVNGQQDATTISNSTNIANATNAISTDSPSTAGGGTNRSDGSFAMWSLWRCALSLGEIQRLYRGVLPIRLRAQCIVYCWPLQHTATAASMYEDIAGSNTLTNVATPGSTNADIPMLVVPDPFIRSYWTIIPFLGSPSPCGWAGTLQS